MLAAIESLNSVVSCDRNPIVERKLFNLMVVNSLLSNNIFPSVGCMNRGTKLIRAFIDSSEEPTKATFSPDLMVNERSFRML